MLRRCCCSWGRNCAWFYCYSMNKQWIWLRFGSNPPPKVNWVECAFNSHRPKPNCQRKVWTRPMCIQCALNSVLVSSVKRPLHFWTKAFSSCGVVCSLTLNTFIVYSRLSRSQICLQWIFWKLSAFGIELTLMNE